MHLRGTFVILVAVVLTACGSEQPDVARDVATSVHYAFDFSDQNVPIGEGEVASGIGGWTSTFACAVPSGDSKAGALSFDDDRVPDWIRERDGGTPSPITRTGLGVLLAVEQENDGAFAVSLTVGERSYVGTAPADHAAVGLHHVGYAAAPQLLAIKDMKLAGEDGASLTLTGTASFPAECAGF